MTDRNKVSLRQYDRFFHLWWEFIYYPNSEIGWQVFASESGGEAIAQSDSGWDLSRQCLCHQEVEQHCQWILETVAEKYAVEYKRSRLADLLEEYAVRDCTINEMSDRILDLIEGIESEEGRFEFE